MGRRFLVRRPIGMHILVLNWQDRLHPRAGGAEHHLHQVFGRLVQRGHSVTAVVSGWPGAAPREVVSGIDVRRVGTRATYPLAVRRYLRSTLGLRQFDVVVEDVNKVPLFTPKWIDRPIAAIAHHLFGLSAFLASDPVTAGVTAALERLIGPVYRAVPFQAVSSSTARDLTRLGVPASHVTVIPNGVDAQSYQPAAGVSRFPVPTLLYVGRLARYKRVDILLRAAARLARQGTVFRVLIAGSGDQRPRLARLTRRLGLERYVEFLGYVDDAAKRTLYRRAWVHVTLSMKEGWGISCAEAAACGTPSVVSEAPGLRDVVHQHVTGIIVPYADPVATADALSSLIRAPTWAEQLGANARRRMTPLTWELTADRTEEHLAAVCEGRWPNPGDWMLLAKRHPFSDAQLPRNGPPELPFGVERYEVTCDGRSGVVAVEVYLGTRDPGGYWPVLIMRWNGEERVQELEGRPIAPVRFIERHVSRLVGRPLAITLRPPGSGQRDQADELCGADVREGTR